MSTQRDCQYCATRFTVKTEQRLFCSDRCRQRYHRENRLKCFYCGELATDRDHIFPQSARIPGGGNYQGQETVNSCSECNCLMGNRHAYDLLARIRYLIRKLDLRYQLDKQIPEWSGEELDEMGRDLRRMISAKIKERQRALERRSHAQIVHDRIARLTHADVEEPEVEPEEID